MQQFIWLNKCGVPHHPVVANNTGNQHCQVVLHHLHVNDASDLVLHLEREFSGLAGTRHNDWSQNVGPLGCIIKVCGSGAGVAHAEIVHMDAGIFK